MAKFGGMTLTTPGRNLLAKALTGAELKFTRVSAGDGRMPDGQNIQNMTAMVHHIRDLRVETINVTGVGTATIQTVMSNKGLAAGFFVREIGLWAQDPDGGEVLYGYCNAGDEADYMPGQDGPDAVEYLFSLVTVIDQATNVTAVIQGGLVYATREELNTRMDRLFGKVGPIADFWTRSDGDDKSLRPTPLADVRRAILGLADIGSLNRRVERLEDIIAQILLEMEVQNIYPNYSHWIIEDFRVVDQIDLYTCRVNSVVAGDDSLDCKLVAGMLPGSQYTLSDGMSSELVRVKSVSIENGVQRVILNAPVENTYRLGSCRLTRTSATIANGQATGPAGTKSLFWSPGIVWKGQGAETEIAVKLKTDVASAGMFTSTGDVAFTADGLLTLEAR